MAQSDFQIVTNQGERLLTSLELEDSAVIKLADVMLHEAVRYRTMQIQTEPSTIQGRVRYRVDRGLQHVVDLPASGCADRVARRLSAQSLPERVSGHRKRPEP